MDSSKETIDVEEVLFTMKMDIGVCHVVLVLLLSTFGLMVMDVAFIGGFYTLEGRG
jgi:hypothetical protein